MNILRNLAVIIVLLPAAANADLITGFCNGDTSGESVLCDTATGLEWLGLDLLIDNDARWFDGSELALLEVDGWRVPSSELESIFCYVHPTRCSNGESVVNLDYEQEMQTSAESAAITKCYPSVDPECEVTQLLVRGEAVTNVPEPNTLVLLGIGLAAMGLSTRRRKV